ncbi:MAG TPA: HTTM domain-containing protein, partial [Planctomycetaceae bacterium]|nr:HTTM domain-containing protein [Planctomycetaceae bacterium]
MLGKLFRPIVADAREKFEKFFFAEEAPYAIAMTRIYLPLVIVGVMLHRWYYARELYTADGAPAPLADNFGYWNWLPVLPGWAGVALYSLMIFLLFTASIGWYSRCSLAGSAILYAYFGLIDQLSTINKYTVIATHVLLLLSVSDCGAVWSLDSWLARRGKRNTWPGAAPVDVRKSAVWPRRLIQILCGVIYFGAAMTKIHTPSFFSGDQLIYWMMTHFNWSHPVGDLLTQFPSLVVAMCYVTIVWEMTFLFCSWKGWSRVVYVWLGVVFHAMTALTLGLLIFPLVMY